MVRISQLAAISVLAFGTASIAASAADLPPYPGATKKAIPASKPVPVCGHQVSVVATYDTKDAPEKVVAWYKGRVPGAVVFRHNDDPTQTMIAVYDADGARSVIVSLMHFSSALQSSAATLGMDKTDVGLERFDPPLGRTLLGMMRQAGSNPAEAKALSAKLAAACPNG